MSLGSIAHLLDRYLHITPPDMVVRKAVIETLKEALNVDLDTSQISFTNGVVYIKALPGLKQAVFTKKTTIVETINTVIGKNLVRDVR